MNQAARARRMRARALADSKGVSAEQTGGRSSGLRVEVGGEGGEGSRARKRRILAGSGGEGAVAGAVKEK